MPEIALRVPKITVTPPVTQKISARLLYEHRSRHADESEFVSTDSCLGSFRRSLSTLDRESRCETLSSVVVIAMGHTLDPRFNCGFPLLGIIEQQVLNIPLMNYQTNRMKVERSHQINEKSIESICDIDNQYYTSNCLLIHRGNLNELLRAGYRMI